MDTHNSILLDTIDEIESSVHGSKVSGDTYAYLRNIFHEAISRLESIDLKTGDDYILLKWGSVKGFKLNSTKGKRLSNEYLDEGRSVSAMAQKDSQRQKEIILEMIDECDGSIQNDWDGKFYTKQQAKDYINEYGEK